MGSFAHKMSSAKTMSEKDQKKAGTPIAGDIDQEHKDFLKTLLRLLKNKEIVTTDPKSFLKKDVYDNLDQQWKDKTDLALINIAGQIRKIEEFCSSEETPDESPQLQNMVEHLWQMKQRIEDHHDVFIF